MIEVMCAQQFTGNMQSTVLCFTGPPGTGKTTIAKAIASVTSRPLIQIALGGLSDSAELRGHRRTYIASRPGRIITELRDKKSMTPLILLDEVDKLSNFRGDPTAILLELLDPEQNDKFTDHYLEFPVDLSKAMFICTANNENNIPPALKDRMEFIHFREYTKEECFVITNKYLIPKAKAELGLTDYDISFDEQVINRIITPTQIRQIDKRIRKLFRMALFLFGGDGQKREKK